MEISKPYKGKGKRRLKKMQEYLQKKTVGRDKRRSWSMNIEGLSMFTKDYQVCTRCVMDTTDPEITFDISGVCNHCQEFDEVTSRHWFPNEVGEKKLNEIYDKIKRENAKKTMIVYLA